MDLFSKYCVTITTLLSLRSVVRHLIRTVVTVDSHARDVVVGRAGAFVSKPRRRLNWQRRTSTATGSSSILFTKLNCFRRRLCALRHHRQPQTGTFRRRRRTCSRKLYIFFFIFVNHILFVVKFFVRSLAVLRSNTLYVSILTISNDYYQCVVMCPSGVGRSPVESPWLQNKGDDAIYLFIFFFFDVYLRCRILFSSLAICHVNSLLPFDFIYLILLHSASISFEIDFGRRSMTGTPHARFNLHGAVFISC